MSLKTNTAALAAALAGCALTLRAQTPATPADVAGEIGAILVVATGEYTTAVQAGRIVDSLEYHETDLMLTQARDLAAPLFEDPRHGGALATALDSARARMERLAPPVEFKAAIEEARRALFRGWGAAALPRPHRPPAAHRGERLYATLCSACHGPEGRGDGAAGAMEPPPTDFTDPELVMESSPARWFQVLSYGIPGTGMQGWREQLSEQERWDLVAHLARLGFSDAERDAGARLFEELCDDCALTGVVGQAELSGNDIVAKLDAGSAAAPPLEEPEARALVAHVRTLLEHEEAASTVASSERRLMETKLGLQRALELHSAGDFAAARRAALSAYMSFEGAERELGLQDPALVRAIEEDFVRFRAAAGEPGEDARALFAGLQEKLGTAVERLDTQPTAWSDFLGALAIILREGVEAILIIGALLAFLSRSGNAEHRTAVYWGTGTALAASLLTAVAVELIFHIAPASQEALEGVTMLLAVAVLFSVSYWLVSKIEHRRWEAYIRGKVSLALTRGSGFALASVAFLAVYREGFETVLFYKALFGAASSGLHVTAGLGSGLIALAVLCVAIYRFGVRIPLRPFFAATSAVLYYMAFVFAGKGVRELQEAGIVGVTPVPGVARIDLLGIFPTAETLAVQAVLLAALVLALGWTFLLQPARTRVTAEEGA